MKRIVCSLLLAWTIAGCNTDQQPGQAATRADTPAKENIDKDPDQYFFNPTRDLDNFQIKTGYAYIDSIYAAFLKDPHVRLSGRKDICNGDHCMTYQVRTNTDEQMAFYFFKHDYGEYGYDNDQFFTVHDSLRAVRHFRIGIREWPSDTSATLWSVDEEILFFGDTTVTRKERKRFTTSMKNLEKSLDDLPFKSSVMDKTETSKKQAALLTEMLKMESSD